MVVSTMTLQEIHKELFADLHTLNPKLINEKKEFRRKVLKTFRYPYTFTFDYYTKENRNLFIISLTALSKRNAEKPLLSIYGIYARPEGSYAAALSVDFRVTSIYPPHFFKRYRERIVKDDKISNKQLIRLYFDNCCGFYGIVANEKHAAVYNIFESDDNDGVSFVGATDEGYCFGTSFGNINIVKTIVSEKMLFDDQIELFHNLRKSFNKENTDRYGANFKPLQH